MPINNYIIATEPLGEKKAREIIKTNNIFNKFFIFIYINLNRSNFGHPWILATTPVKMNPRVMPFSLCKNLSQ